MGTAAAILVGCLFVALLRANTPDPVKASDCHICPGLPGCPHQVEKAHEQQ